MERQEEGIHRGIRRLLEVMLSQVYVYVKTSQSINFTFSLSIKLLKDKENKNNKFSVDIEK